jgi:hypothetical protein
MVFAQCVLLLLLQPLLCLDVHMALTTASPMVNQ